MALEAAYCSRGHRLTAEDVVHRVDGVLKCYKCLVIEKAAQEGRERARKARERSGINLKRSASENVVAACPLCGYYRTENYDGQGKRYCVSCSKVSSFGSPG